MNTNLREIQSDIQRLTSQQHKIEQPQFVQPNSKTLAQQLSSQAQQTSQYTHQAQQLTSQYSPQPQQPNYYYQQQSKSIQVLYNVFNVPKNICFYL